MLLRLIFVHQDVTRTDDRAKKVMLRKPGIHPSRSMSPGTTSTVYDGSGCLFSGIALGSSGGRIEV